MQVELMSHSGDDLLVVNAARTSFGKESKLVTPTSALRKAEEMESTATEEVKAKIEKYKDYVLTSNKKYVLTYGDYNLLQYLAREKHILPFRHPQISMRIKVPIFLARQLGKHQVGMSWSEESRRYITTEPEFFWPDKWRKAAENVKQGSSDDYIDPEYVFSGDYGNEEGYSVKEYEQYARNLYNWMLKTDVAPELARMILPQNMYITAVWTGSLLSFYQMYKLRSEAHAQKEARDFAEMVKAEIVPLYPESWAALQKHV